MDSILQVAREGHSVDCVGQREVVAAEVVVIVLEARRPMRCECPLQASAGCPAGPSRGSSGINRNPQDRCRESNVSLFLGPSGTAFDVSEPTGRKTITYARSSRRQKVIADGELRGKDRARDRVSSGAGGPAAQARPRCSTLNAYDPCRRKLIVTTKLSTSDETSGAE